MAKTIAISQVNGVPSGSGGASTPANVTVGTITFSYIWDNQFQSVSLRPNALRLQVPYTKPGGWTGTGVHAFVEYPDQSAVGAFTLDGTTALDRTSQLGGSWKPMDLGQFPDDGAGFITLDLIQIPEQTVNIRVYLVGYNALADPSVVRNTAGSPSPSGVVTVTPPPIFASGQENAQNVTGLTAFTQYAVNAQGQLVLQLFVAWTPPADPNFQGVFITMHRPAQTVTASPGTRVGSIQANALDVNSGLLVGTTWTHELSQFPTATEFDTLYCLSVDTNGNVNSIAPGVTPSVVVEVDVPPQGSAGTEYTSPVTNFSASVIYPASVNTADGIEQYFFTGSFTAPSDPSWGGITVYAHDQANGTDHTKDIPLGTLDKTNAANWRLGPYTITDTVWDLYAVSYDVNGISNSLVPGTTPRVVGLQAVPQTSGSMLGNRIADGTLPIAPFASTLRPVLLLSSDPTLPDSHYPAGTIMYRTDTHVLKKVNAAGTAWGLAVNGATDIIANSITAGQIQAGAITTTELTTGTIKIGGGGGKPGQLEIDDGSGTAIGWIGTDSGNVGAWFKTCRVGGSSYATAPFQADSSGNVTINGATLTLNSNGAITTINNSSVLGLPSGLQVQNSSNTTDYAAVSYPQITIAKGGVAKAWMDYSVVFGGGLHVQNPAASASADVLGSGVFQVNGSQVVSARKTGWSAWTGVATRSSVATGSATVQNCAEAIKALIDDLISHGLIGA